MAQIGFKMGLALVLMTATWASSSAQLNCPPPVISFQSCIGYITSNLTVPGPQCCTQLTNMVQTQAQCICTIMNAIPQLPFNVNQTQAINLPGACNIQAQCSGAAPSGQSVPAAGPAQQTPSPAAPSDISPSTSLSPPSVPSGGSKAGQGHTTSSARISSKFSPFIFFFMLVVLAMCSS